MESVCRVMTIFTQAGKVVFRILVTQQQKFTISEESAKPAPSTPMQTPTKNLASWTPVTQQPRSLRPQVSALSVPTTLTLILRERLVSQIHVAQIKSKVQMENAQTVLSLPILMLKEKHVSQTHVHQRLNTLLRMARV